MAAKIIDGKKIAAEIRQSIAEDIKQLSMEYSVTPNVASIIIGENPESHLYLKLRDRACENVGIHSSHYYFPENVSEKTVLQTIERLNKEINTHGILVQFPLPAHLSQQRLIQAVNPLKDVEGLTPYNLGRTLLGDEYIIPCTPLAVLTILEYEKTNLEGKNVVVINHSAVVGKPLAALFLNRNATVTICHIFTRDTRRYASEADVLVSATGVPGLITAEYVKKDAFVIDVGIAKTEDGVSGDVDFDCVKEKVQKITPVPGGVGPVTVACSMLNMVKTFRNCVEEKST